MKGLMVRLDRLALARISRGASDYARGPKRWYVQHAESMLIQAPLAFALRHPLMSWHHLTKPAP